MVVDVDEKKIFQSLQPGALHAIAFQDNGGVIIAIHFEE